MMEEHDLISVNMSDHPTFFTTRAKGWTDVCLVTSELAQSVIDCETLLTNTASDHRFIMTQINRVRTDINYGYISSKHINWELYRKTFNEIWSNHDYPKIKNVNDIDNYVKILTTDIQQARDRARKTTTRKAKRSTHWWTEELDKQRKMTNKIRKRYQRSITNEQKQKLKEEYRKQLRNYKKLINTTRSKAWKEFCNESNNRGPWELPYNLVIRKKKNSKFQTFYRKQEHMK
ncbi:uncharacterized protein LOC111614926 [Centruroides sculpturatus]|uniref:uncharacterized protein LOC111614926 n=1 Tax=Centruroides sculpturatus TaxID=218467 RepID=UPI000C6EFBAA|nr:uncharacterized protein LOC111614926 [Centruroides sculpturatus]